ncbi:MAG TPA: class I SAM-dependent rRNA methyltransferase [Thermoanaerobaculia bacterium]|nr:class I SAM-dependent rRNA methyltransferase [Thermoanaerobaculia bacterium]
MAASSAVVHLRPEKEKAALRGHPWVFSGAVARIEGDLRSALARVRSAHGKDLGWALFNPDSRIPVRLLHSRAESIGREFFAERLAAARALRAGLPSATTTGYRLLNAEGDGLPGWTVDRYDSVLVSQITSAGLEKLRGEAYAALAAAYPGLAIRQRNDLTARRQEGLASHDETISGEVPEEVEFLEGGLRFVADLAGGQKTGYYCDQRENRERVAALAAGRRVLDLFAHTGAFGLYALRGGAAQVTAVESSPRLAELALRQLAANGFAPERLEWRRADVGAELRRNRELYELVICDPPPLAPRKSDVERGARAYKDLNRLALGRVAPGGFYLTFSCSAGIDPRLFRQILFAAADEAGVSLSLLAPLAAGPDHPVDIFHPEGEYLKGWLGYVRG